MVPPLDLDGVAAYHYLSVPCHYSNRRIVDRRTPATPSPFFWLIVASVVCTRIDRFSFLFINLFCYAYPLQNAAPPTFFPSSILVHAAVQQLRHSIAINFEPPSILHRSPAIPNIFWSVKNTPHRSVNNNYRLLVILD